MTKKPNILLITTDQQRFDTISALGNPYIYTPHLNWLADEGITFTNCYADCPVCIPSRTTIMTGRHGYAMGLVGNQSHAHIMNPQDTLPGILTRSGYQTRAQGKMHFIPMRANYGFEHMELPMDYYRERNRNVKEGVPKMHGVGENEAEPVISTVREQDSLTQWTVNRSIDFLETRDETRPFFLWTSFTKPHPPFDPCYNYWALYQNREMPAPVKGDWSQSAESIPGFASVSHTLNNVHRMSDSQITDMQRAYYACITQIDYALGLLFGRMRELGLLENTWILFTSDHGDMMGDHGMGAKSVFFEGSAHIPMLIRPPLGDFQKTSYSNGLCDTLCDLADIMPTILNLAGVDVPEAAEGDDLMSLYKQDLRVDHVLYGNTSDRFFMVRDARFKYTYTNLGGMGLLFDLTLDPYEQKNLANDPAHANRLKRMHGLLIEHIRTYSPSLLKGDDIIIHPAPQSPRDVLKWPGLHSTVHNSDVLH